MSNNKTVFTLILAVLLSFIPFAHAVAGGYNLAGVGSKALAMSGAFRGISDDWSAMFWNPAGLAGQQNMVSVSAKFLYPIVWLTPAVPSTWDGYDYQQYAGYHPGVEMTTKEKAFPSGSLGIVRNINDKITAGISVFAPSALGADWQNLFTGPPAGYNNTVEYTSEGWFSDLKVIDIHPTVAYQVNDMLKLGLGIAIQYGDIMLESPKTIPTEAPLPFQHFYVDAILEGTGIGYGFNVGAMLKLTDQMNVGLSYRGPVTIPIEGSVKQTLYHPYSLGLQQQLPDKAALFNGGTSVAEPDGNADFPLPMDLGLGIAYDALPNLTVAFDVIFTQWSSVDEILIELDGVGPTGEPAEDSKLAMEYEDTYRFNFGFDWLVSETNDMHLRGGYYFDPTPIPDGSLRPTITDVADKQNISLGFSYMPKENMVIEGYYEHVFTDTRTIDGIDLNNDGELDNIAGDWKLQVDIFGVTFGYRFGGK